MALVMNASNVKFYLSENLAVTGDEETVITVDGEKHAEMHVFPVQEKLSAGATLMVLRHPFVEFAKSFGGPGKMKTSDITSKYPQIPEDVAETLADDFACYYGNYAILPMGTALMITHGVPSIDYLCKKRETAAVPTV